MWQLSAELEERRIRLLDEGYEAFCLFSMAGNEIKIANELNKVYTDILVLPFFRMKHLCQKGVRSVVQDLILPGYVFAFVPKGAGSDSFQPVRTGFRVLKSEENPQGILKGSDRKYAEWVMNTGGVIGMSKAIRKDGKIKIVSGPLASLEGKVVEYSPRSRSCRIEVELFGRFVSTWLPYEMVEEANCPN